MKKLLKNETQQVTHMTVNGVAVLIVASLL
jgi:hypothetical protein